MNTISTVPAIDLSAGILSTASPRLPGAVGSSQTERHGDQLLGKELESMFASLLIKSMRETLTEEGLFPGDSADALGSLFDQYMGQQVAAGQGLGLAQSLARSNQAAAAYRAGSPHD